MYKTIGIAKTISKKKNYKIVENVSFHQLHFEENCLHWDLKVKFAKENLCRWPGLKNVANFMAKHLQWRYFLTTFLKKYLHKRYFPINFSKKFQNRYFKGCLWGKLLTLDLSLVYISSTGNSFSVFLFNWDLLLNSKNTTKKFVVLDFRNRGSKLSLRAQPM